MKLREKHFEAIQLQLEGRSIGEVQAALGVPRSTFLRWRSDPDYIAELEKGRGHRMPELRGRCTDYASVALEVLHENMTAPDATRSERTAAAKVILDRAGLDAIKENRAIDVNFSVYPQEGDSEQSYMARLTEMARQEREDAH